MKTLINKIINYISRIVYKSLSIYKCFTPVNDINKTNQTNLKDALHNWINDTYKPTHFLTIQLPDNLKTSNLDNAKSHLKNIMKAFEKSLIHNWNRHHLPFIAFAELGLSQQWHFHILLNQGKFTEEELQNAIIKTNWREKLPSYCLDLKPIENNLSLVDFYCSKEMKVYFNNKFDSDRIIISHDLFGLSYEATSVF